MPAVPTLCCSQRSCSAGRLFLLLLFSTLLASSISKPIRCAPCTAEKMALCPSVTASCLETARQPGCGCCQTCALQLGSSCGVYTARCGKGLKCQARQDESRPIAALLQGRGTCVEGQGDGLWSAEAFEASDFEDPENVTPESAEMTQEQLLANYQLAFPSGHDKPALWNAISFYESMRADRNSGIGKKENPCQTELQKTLDRLSVIYQRPEGEISKFYLPNCSKNGFYHSKQCETSLDGEPVLCWCVNPLNGKRIPGSPDVIGDPKCRQYFNVQN
ncbi:insulin-like growth factor-binding protein 1 [Ornithorhynchus anatinus]|uniref:Insulin-like growth factor-binding protein 1 n=1 Tax=Ornithorhynchus anatinus TaxID=9258 RepID=F7BMX9_ORNAN|nr:insulin-like growth factor-binding protein 1 [Ornithorhynchus anatinus]